ncbi:hypothetical protein BSL78_23919 [Apostichopus japonicus]|uniref:Uncharacterized protein n=1 Tax=Stichopus japonicus TaxID=307972 RepID=A0A2G8JU67_STIJA|nr:hypothetical protein BSL78_23919 [Apostichopus japonicus]
MFRTWRSLLRRGKMWRIRIVAVWNNIEAIETIDELPIPHEVLPDDPNQCKETNKAGRNFLSVFIAFISGIISACVSIYLTHRYQPQVLKHIMDYRPKGHFKVEDRYEHTTNSLNDRPTRRMTDTSPSTIQRKYLTNRKPEIRHSYFAGSCTVSAVNTNDVEQEYFPIQDDRSSKDAFVSDEDIYSSCEEHTNKATNARIKKARSWKTELAYAVSEVTLSDNQKGKNPPTGNCSSQDDNFTTDVVEYVDPDEYDCKTGKNMITSPETVLSSTYEADLSGTVKYSTLEKDTEMDLEYAVSHVQMSASPTSTKENAKTLLGNAPTGNFDYVDSDEFQYKLEKNLSESRESVTPEEVQSINGNTMAYTEINRKPPPVKEKPRSVLVRKFSTEDVVDTTLEYKASLSSSVK